MSTPAHARSSTGFRQLPASTTLEGYGVKLSPLLLEHVNALEQASADGKLWTLNITTAPAPGQGEAYIAQALQGQQAGHSVPFIVTEIESGAIIGTTRYYEVVPEIARLAIGYTWYAKRWQRTHINTACKLLLLEHAFGVLGASVVAWHTDIANIASQRAIERLGAQKDGVLRHHALRRDGTVRDTVSYSMLASEWPAAQQRLQQRLTQ